ncbi:MAG: DUF2585 family protein [Acetobacterales bacterium]
MKWLERGSRGLWLFSLTGPLALQTLILLAMGLPAICTCGHVELWHGNPSGPETSQHVADWYTFTHVLHGIGFYFLLWLIAPRMPFAWRFALAIGLEAAWEVLENTPLIVERYRQGALARGYSGDSIVNSVSDTLATALGVVMARFLPTRPVIALVIASELFLGYTIRDNLTLNIVQLVYPSEAISQWQTGR